ncbi:uncharacterized protein [Battus philenor]|uniref:uncharacterized protein n=1 Tax=Battus philenor TaxID=42288 RepID=UPI0035D0665A
MQGKIAASLPATEQALIFRGGGQSGKSAARGLFNMYDTDKRTNNFMKMLMKLRFKNKHQLYAVLFLAAFSLTSLYLILIYHEPPKVYPDRHMSRQQVQIELKESILEETEQGCQFPELDPFSDEVMKFNKDIPKIKCEGVDWVECNRSECSVVDSILKKMRDVVCIYKDIVYLEDHDYKIGNPVKVYGDESYVLNVSDHVKVSCSGTALDGLGMLSTRWYGYKAGLRPVRVENVTAGDGINVMILCFDSTSHNGFRRRMPRSYKTLEEMGATVLQGYNIIGDGTPAAIIPLLSGKTELELPEARIKFAKNKLVDPEYFIFKILKKYGYHTAYFEDMPWIGTFQYRYNGFKAFPADHYLRAFFLEESKYGAKWWNGINRRHCVGAVPQYGLLLNLSKQFTGLQDKHYCFTFIADITHEDFNMISLADDDVVTFLKHMRESGKLDDHLLIVMGDHGTRYSPLRETYQGKIEERLPLMAIILPEKLKKNRPNALAALRNNSRVLTTPFDIHTTIVDAMGLKHLANDYVVPGANMTRGMSLLEPIPQNRTCGQAAVLSHWCVCTKWYNVEQSNNMYRRAATALAAFINNITEEVRSSCVSRKLISVDWVMRQRSNEDILNFRYGSDGDGLHHKYVTAAVKAQPSSEYYQAKIVMSPGWAVFEGSMKYYAKTQEFVVSENDISRITAYANEPACISTTHPHLNKFCFCKDRLSQFLVV